MRGQQPGGAATTKVRRQATARLIGSTLGSPSLGDDYAAGEGGFARGGEKTVKVGFLDRAVGVIEHALEGATRGKALKEQYQWEVQWKGKPSSGSVAADITLYFGTKRSADWDNFHKLTHCLASLMRMTSR